MQPHHYLPGTMMLNIPLDSPPLGLVRFLGPQTPTIQ
jgi:hypothetical protein